MKILITENQFEKVINIYLNRILGELDIVSKSEKYKYYSLNNVWVFSYDINDGTLVINPSLGRNIINFFGLKDSKQSKEIIKKYFVNKTGNIVNHVRFNKKSIGEL